MKIKICCISSLVEAELALAAGADHLGLVGPMPSGPGVLGLKHVRQITDALPGSIDSWLLTSKTTAQDVISEFDQSGCKSLQLTDAMDQGEELRLREHLEGVHLTQVIHVIDEAALDEVAAAQAWCDAILLDSGNPKLTVKQLGGTGRTHNWSISRRIVELCSVPVYLAGGLGPENVREAIEQVQPAGVDLCSGVRRGGHLDEELLDEYMDRARRAQ